MDEIYRKLKSMIQEMHEKSTTQVTMDYEHVAKLYQMVCYMRQIKEIANGWD